MPNDFKMSNDVKIHVEPGLSLTALKVTTKVRLTESNANNRNCERDIIWYDAGRSFLIDLMIECERGTAVYVWIILDITAPQPDSDL